jgi:hypothetical protein
MLLKSRENIGKFVWTNKRISSSQSNFQGAFLTQQQKKKADLPSREVGLSNPRMNQKTTVNQAS